MNTLILAQAAGGMTIIQWLMIAIVVAAVAAIMIAAFKHFGIAIPQLFITVLWIVVGAVICLVAIKFVAGLIWN